MSAQKTVLHLISVALLLIWGGVMLYFYVSGRIVNYLPPLSEGWFRPMALAGGIGLILLGVFNLATMGSAEEGACCEHDHDHHHDHDHAHGDCCGHNHDHDHKHEEHASCGHDHKHEHHDCCAHGHDHDHHHDHSHEEHAHGILEESGPIGRTVAILILGVPVLLAAALTPDKFSGRAAVNKGLYSPNYSDTSRAEQFTLRKDTAKEAAKPTTQQTAAMTQDTPPGTVVNQDGTKPGVGDLPPATTNATAKAGSPPAAKSATQSFGEFTLEDLKAQVPMSKDGNFVLEVPELFYTAGDLEVQKVLAGQPIETIAQVMPEKVNNADGKRLRILRLLVQCCAADARPYSVPVQFDEKAPTFKEMTWVKVVGKMSYEKEGEQIVPLVKVSKIEETTAPDQSMLY